MADSRIKDAADEVISSEIQALLNTLYFAVDDSSFSDFQKILLKSFLTEAIVDANTNNYQALTPKAFYDSVMTTTRKGIGQLAADADVTSKSGAGLLNSAHQTLMQAQWFQDWCTSNGKAKFWSQSNSDLENGGAISFNASFKGDLAQYGYAVMSPALVAGATFDALLVSVYWKSNSNADRVVTQIDSHTIGAESQVNIGGSAWITISPDGTEIRVKAKSAQTNVRIALTCQAILA